MKINVSELLIGAILGLVATLQAQLFYIANERSGGISAYITASDGMLTSVGLFATGSAPLCIAVDTVANLLYLTKRTLRINTIEQKGKKTAVSQSDEALSSNWVRALLHRSICSFKTRNSIICSAT